MFRLLCRSGQNGFKCIQQLRTGHCVEIHGAEFFQALVRKAFRDCCRAPIIVHALKLLYPHRCQVRLASRMLINGQCFIFPSLHSAYLSTYRYLFVFRICSSLEDGSDPRKRRSNPLGPERTSPRTTASEHLKLGRAPEVSMHPRYAIFRRIACPDHAVFLLAQEPHARGLSRCPCRCAFPLT